MNIRSVRNAVSDWLRRVMSKRAGFWGTLLLVALMAARIIGAAGDMDFIAQHWNAISSFLQAWGFLIGFGIAGALIAKAVYDTASNQEPPQASDGGSVFFRATVSQSPPVGTHPADVENKLKAIIQTLAFIREQAPIDKLIDELITTWIHVAKRGDRAQFAEKVETVSKMLTAFYQGNGEQGERVREYDHVGDVLSEVPHRDHLDFLTQSFAEAIRQTDNVLLLEPRAKDWREWMERWRVWRQSAEDRLIQLKRKISR